MVLDATTRMAWNVPGSSRRFISGASSTTGGTVMIAKPAAEQIGQKCDSNGCEARSRQQCSCAPRSRVARSAARKSADFAFCRLQLIFRTLHSTSSRGNMTSFATDRNAYLGRLFTYQYNSEIGTISDAPALPDFLHRHAHISTAFLRQTSCQHSETFLVCVPD